MRRVHTSSRAPSAPLVSMTLGTAEENYANNLRLAGRLRALGLPVAVGEIPDAHTFTCWRDAFDPHLVDLLTTLWS